MKMKGLTALAVSAGLALSIGFVALPKTAAAADMADVKVASAALRVPGDGYSQGIRFRLEMTDAYYTANNAAWTETGILIAPTKANADLTIGSTHANVVQAAITAAWEKTADGNNWQTYVHLYDVEKADYTTELSVRAYVDYAEDANDLLSETVSCSVAEVAQVAYGLETDESKKTDLQTEYLTYKATYYSKGAVLETQNVVYGEKLSVATPTRANHTFDGWYNEKGDREWDMETYTVPGDVRLFAKWTVTDKVTLIDAATEASLFSNTYVASTDSGKNVMGWGADKDTTYATTTDTTHGSVIETNNAKAYIYGWINFNTGVAGDLNAYWTNKLDGLDKIVFYAYNGTDKPHAIRFASADGGLATAYVTLKGNDWTQIVLDKNEFLKVFANIPATGNPYIMIHFKNSDGGNNGGPGDTTFKFSSFYGYTAQGYENEFYKTATVLDADADFARFSDTALSGDTGYHISASAMRATFTKVTDETYGAAVQATVTAHNWTAAGFINFNAGVADTKAYWTEKLAGLDKIVFYMYHDYSTNLNVAIRNQTAGSITGNTSCASDTWTMVTIDVATFLSGIQSQNPYICFADNNNPSLVGKTFKFTSFVGYSNAAYERAFPNA